MVLIVLILGILFIICASVAESLEIKERYMTTDPLLKKRLNRSWHSFQYFERASAILFGFGLAFLPIYNALATLFLMAALFWLVYDGAINTAFNRPFLHRSTTGTSSFDKIAYPPVKIGSVLLAVILLILTIV